MKERDASTAAIDAEVFAGVVPPPPMQTQIQRMGGMSSAVIGGFCEHSPASSTSTSGGELAVLVLLCTSVCVMW
jgi:hypothetical protein